MITDNKFKHMECNKKSENYGHIENTYKIGDEVLNLKRGIKIKYSR